RHHRRSDHGDPEQLLHLAVAAANGRAALSRFVRQEMPRRDPKPGGGNKADGGQAAGFHRALSLMSTMRAACSVGFGEPPRSIWRVMFMKIGSTASALKSGSSARRHHTPSV